MYKKATRLKLRISTPKGMLSAEQLYDLSQTDIAASIKAVKKVLKKNDDDELSFLEDAKIVDTENELRFEILKDVYLTKKSERDALRDAAEVKNHNEKIDAYIARKQESEMEKLSIAELEALRK